MARKADHVVISKDAVNIGAFTLKNARCRLQLYAPSLKCLHCGEGFPMPTGLIPWVTAVSNAFVAAHKNCQPTTGAPNVNQSL